MSAGALSLRRFGGGAKGRSKRRRAVSTEYNMLLTATLCLLALGAVMVFSASSTTQVLRDGGLANSAYYLKRTLIVGAIGLVLMHFTARHGLTAIRRATPLLLGGSLFLLVAVICHMMLNYTRFGRSVFALGGNLQAARVSGININRVLMGVYILMGTLAGLAGLILAGRTGSGNPTLGTQMEMDAIASTVIGGTAFTGGIGTIWGAIVGALLIGSINTGLTFLNVSPFMQQVVKGAIIVVAIVIDERKNRHR